MTQGYHQALKPRQIQHDRHRRRHRHRPVPGRRAPGCRLAGPALALVYGACGFFCFFILRALGELVMYRPTVGQLCLLCPRIPGRKGLASSAGWMFFLNWAMTGIVDITAVALYMHYWGAFGGGAAMGVRGRRAGFRRRHEPAGGELVRRAGILVLADQGDGADAVPGGRRAILLATGHPVAGRAAGPAS